MGTHIIPEADRENLLLAVRLFDPVDLAFRKLFEAVAVQASSEAPGSRALGIERQDFIRRSEVVVDRHASPSAFETVARIVVGEVVQIVQARRDPARLADYRVTDCGNVLFLAQQSALL